MHEEKAPISGQNKEKTSWKDIIKEVIIFAIIAFGIVLPFRIYVAEPYLVDGRSMDPTFETGQYLIVDKISYRINGGLERGSVIVFNYPNDPNKNFIKRVIGLPGETISIEGGKVTIKNTENPEGFIFDDSFIVFKSENDVVNTTLAPDEYFVMGDNRLESFDSRSWGPLNKKYILGEPMIRLLPLSKIDLMPGKINN